MGKTYDELVTYTEGMMKIVNKKYVEGNYMAYLPILSGIAQYKIESRPGAGHNYYAVVDAIHNCYARKTESGFDAGFKDGIRALIRVSTAKVGSLDMLLNIVFYQLDKEKNGTAEFNIDIDETMDSINKLIRENMSNYEADNIRFKPWLEKIQKYALEKYGLELG